MKIKQVQQQKQTLKQPCSNITSHKKYINVVLNSFEIIFQL